MRILLLEDNPADAELIEYELRESFPDFVLKWVVTEEDFFKELHESPPDLILSDYDLPRYNGALALADTRRLCPDVPFILVTGAVSEDRAIEILTSGAKDYVLKTRLNQRLVPAVQRALAEAEEHRARHKAEDELREAHRTLEEKVRTRTAELEAEMEARTKLEQALRESERRRAEELATILAAVPTPVIIVHDPESTHMTGNRAADELLRRSHGEEVSLSAPSEVRPSHFKAIKDGRELRLDELPAQRAARGEHVQDFEFSLVFDDGTTKHLLSYGTPLLDEQGQPRGAVHTLVDITGRKRAEEALRQSESQERARAAELQALVDAVPGITFIAHDPECRKMTGSRATNEFLRLPPQDNVSKSALDSEKPLTFRAMKNGVEISPEELPVQQAAKGHEVRDYALDIVFSDGIVRSILGNASPVLDEQGNPRGAIGVFVDVTEHKQAEEALRNEKERFQILTQNLSSGVALIDESGRLAIVNPAFLRIFEISEESDIKNINDRNWADWQVFDEKGTLLDVDEHPVRKAAITGKAVLNQLVGMRPPANSELKWMLVTAAPIFRPDGRQEATICTYLDVTERKRSEEALRESEETARRRAEELEKLMDLIPAAVWVAHDPQCRIINGNRAANDFYEAGEGENVSAGAERSEQDLTRRFFHNGRELLPEELPMQEAAIRNKDVKNSELDVLLPSGNYITIMGNATPLQDPSGQVRGCIGVFVDITERKQEEEALRREHEFTSKVMETVGSLIIVLDRDGRITQFNRACEAVTGYSFQEVQGRIFWDFLIPAEEKSGVKETWGELLSGRSPNTHENEWLARDGKRHLIAWSNSALTSDSGEVQYVIGTGIDITERKQAEEKLRNSEGLYRAIGESIDYGVWVCEPDGRNIYASESFLNLVGLTQEQCSNFGWGDVLHPDDAERTIAAWKECIRTGSFWDIEHRFRGVDGQWHPVLARGVPVRNDQGEILYWAGINLDISNLKRAEAELARLASFPLLNPDPIIEVDLTGVIHFCNPAAERMFPDLCQLKLKHPLLANVEAFVHSFREAGLNESTREVSTGGRWYLETIQFVEERKRIRIYGHDITIRKQAEDTLRESEVRFRTMANSIPQLAWIARADGFIFWYNQRWFDYTGTTPEQMERYGWQSVHDPKVLPEVTERWKTAIATGEPFDMEFPLLGADKVFRPFLTRILPLKDEQGRVIQWFGTNTDLSERKRAEEELALNEREFRLLAESMPQIVWTTRVDGWNTYFNQRWVDYTGLTLEESYGHGWNKPFHPDDRQRSWDAWQNAVLHNAPYLLQCRLRRADGIYRWWLIHGVPVFDENGNIIKWYGTCTDINDLKIAEETLNEQARQLEDVNKELESFSYTVSHDLQAPLRAIRGFSDMILKDGAATGAETKRKLAIIQDNAERCSSLIDDLLALSRVGRQGVSFKLIDMNALVKDVWEELKAAYHGKHLTLKIKDLLPAYGDQNLIRQVLANLLSNAIKFSANRKRIVVEVGSNQKNGE